VNLSPTLATLAIFTAIFLAVRQRWHGLSPRTHRICITAALVLLTFSALKSVAGWSYASDTLNTLLEWCRDLSFIFLMLLFTTVRPRWLSLPIAVILILPIFASSVILPLGEIFNSAPITYVDLGSNIQTVKIPFYKNEHNSGVDFVVYYRPAWMPLLRHRITGDRFVNTQCNASETFAILDLASKPTHVIVHCPAWTSQANYSGRVISVPLH
jgi:hypothetical protein